jgi:hypothetical protein
MLRDVLSESCNRPIDMVCLLGLAELYLKAIQGLAISLIFVW